MLSNFSMALGYSIVRRDMWSLFPQQDNLCFGCRDGCDVVNGGMAKEIDVCGRG
jgi:hypothetical protein